MNLYKTLKNGFLVLIACLVLTACAKKKKNNNRAVTR